GDVAADGGLGHIETLHRERVDQFALAADRARRDELADRALAGPLEFLTCHALGDAITVHAVPVHPIAVHAAPTAWRLAVMRVPNVGSSSGRSSPLLAPEAALVRRAHARVGCGPQSRR